MPVTDDSSSYSTSSGQSSPDKSASPNRNPNNPSSDDNINAAQRPSKSVSKSPPPTNHVSQRSPIRSENGQTEVATASCSEPTAESIMAKAFELSQQQFGKMLQNLPLLTSVLPALQRLSAQGIQAATASSAPVEKSENALAGGGISCTCGVKFNSAANLEVHKIFYCSQRLKRQEFQKEIIKDSHLSENDEKDETGVLKCPHCPYTTNHKLSLNGHMNLHTYPEQAVTSAPNLSPSMLMPNIAPEQRAQEKYCADCDIQFSSLKTFKVHKAHYCQTRHVLKGPKSPSRDENTSTSSTSNIGGVGQPVLALATNPILLLPYSMIAGAQLLPPHILPQLGAAFVLPNGQFQHIPSASLNTIPTKHSSSTEISPTSFSSLKNEHNANLNLEEISSQRKRFNREVEITLKCEITDEEKSENRISKEEKDKCKQGKRGGESPLDLTTKRPKLYVKTNLLSDEEKENRDHSVSPTASLSPPKNKEFRNSPKCSTFGDLIDDDTESESPLSRNKSPKAPIQSPRTAALSPRASTSNQRSPGHFSPESSIPMSSPNAFPSHFLNNLETLSSSFPLASLQWRELALKMINPDLVMNGVTVPPVIPPPVIVKQGEAKCEECNIVFYKEESLQIHKKHYCSSRDTKPVIDIENNSNPSPTGIKNENTSPSNSIMSNSHSLRSPIRELPSNSAMNKDIKPMKQILQFICTACGIKFSSPDNLTAHQTYYCPKKDSTGEDGNNKGAWRCSRCKVVMSESMQAAHQCVNAVPTTSHGWKCPCCPMLSPTAASAQKHLETHAGIKAFRCTICGYRGNTLRGMRTHIRIHFEKRSSDLQEENFIACILDDDPRRNSQGIDLQPRNLMDTTRMLLENSALAAAFLGECIIEPSVSGSNGSPFKCSYCPFVTPDKTTLFNHLVIIHKSGLDSTELQNLFMAQYSMENASGIKHEVNVDSDVSDQKSPRESKTARRMSSSSESNVECDFGSLSSIKLEPEINLEVGENEEKSTGRKNLRNSPNKVGTNKFLNDGQNNCSQKSDNSTPSPVISPNPRGISKNQDDLKFFSQYRKFSNRNKDDRDTGVPENNSKIEIRENLSAGEFFCQVCNISFSALDSYIAHKRLYCSRPSSSTPPETTVQ